MTHTISKSRKAVYQSLRKRVRGRLDYHGHCPSVLGKVDTTPEQAQDILTNDWFNARANSESNPVSDGTENGYSFVLWQLYCPLNSVTQKPEFTYMKAIQGNDSLYLVQVAFRFESSEADVTQWIKYLKDVKVCDSRISDRACP